MTELTAFLHREIAHLDSELIRLETHLATYALDDPHSMGDRALLRAQHAHRQWITRIIESQPDADMLLDRCTVRLMDMEQQHAKITANGGAHDLRHAESWWDTLHEIQCVTDLISRLRAFHHAHP
jgi:hypothetical protein